MNKKQIDLLKRAKIQIELLGMTFYDANLKKAILPKERQLTYINYAIEDLKQIINHLNF